MIIDRKLEKKIIRHVLSGGALSDLGLPFRTVIDALRNAAVGAIGEGGTYATSFDPVLLLCYSIKGKPDGLRYDADRSWQEWTHNEAPGVCVTGDIGDIWHRLEQHELARLYEQPLGYWRD